MRIISLIGLVTSATFFFYALSPLRFWEKLVIPGQLELIIHSYVILSFLILPFLFLSIIFSKKRILSINLLDIIFGGNILLLTLINYHRIDVELATQICSIFIFYIVIRNVKTTHLPYYFFILPIAGLCQLYYGIASQTQFFIPGKTFVDISGIFLNTGIWGIFIAVLFIVCLGITRYYRPVYSKLFFGICTIIFGFLLVASNSRTAWIAAGSGIVFFSIRELKKYTFSQNQKIIFISAGLLICILCTFPIYHYKKDSADGRLLIWKVGLSMLNEMPVLGLGINGFANHYMDHQATFFNKTPDSKYVGIADENHYAFNEYLRITIEYGILGIALVAGWFIFLYTGWQKEPMPLIYYMAYSALLVISISCLFSYPFSIFQLKLLTVFFIAVIAKYQKPLLVFCIRKKYGNIASVTGMLFIIALLMLSYIHIIQPYATAIKKWNRALTGFQANRELSLSSMQEMHSILNNNHIFLITYGKGLNMAGRYREAIPVLEKSEQLTASYSGLIELGKSYENAGDFYQAKMIWEKAADMIPSRFMPHYLLAKMYAANGEVEQARKIADSLLKKRIKTDTPQLHLMLEEIKHISDIKKSEINTPNNHL